MPTYTIKGNRVKTDAALSDSDIDEIAASLRWKASMTDAYARMARAAQAQGKAELQNLGNLAAGAVKGASQIGATILTPFDWAARQMGIQNSFIGRDDRRQQVTNMLTQLGAQPDAPAYKFGEIGTEIAGTLGVGTVLGLGAKALGAAPRVISALESGGFAKKLPFLARPVAGAVTGGASAGLIDPADAGTGALLGGGLATGVPALGYVFGKARDLLDPNQNALRLIRRVLGNDPAQIAAVQAANAAQPNALASQAAGALPQELPAYQALLKTGELAQPLGEAAAARTAQSSAHIAELDTLRGGATQAEALAARNQTGTSLRAITTPMREQALAAAGEANRVLPRLVQTRQQFAEGAAAKVQDVRRFMPAVERALAWAKTWRPSGATRTRPSGIGSIRGYTPARLATRARQVAEKSAADSLLFGQVRDDATRQIASLEQAGLRPLTADNITSSINARLKDPEIALNKNANLTLQRVKTMLSDWTDQFGGITPDALYAIRKNGISGIVEDLMPQADQKARAAFAAKITAELNPLIDDAIETAGGTGWRDYLKTHADGMKQIERMDLLDRARDMYQTRPDAFIKLVEGNDLDTLRDVFGPGAANTDIKALLGRDFTLLDRMAAYLKTEAKISNAATAGVSSLNAEFANIPASVQIPNFFSPKVNVANAALAGLQGNVMAKTMEVLKRAVNSGATMNELLAAVPAGDRAKVLAAFSSSAIPRTIVPAASGSITNAFAPSNQNAMPTGGQKDVRVVFPDAQ